MNTWTTGRNENVSHQKKMVERKCPKETQNADEIEKCITKLESHKAAREDEIVNEFMKFEEKGMTEIMV